MDKHNGASNYAALRMNAGFQEKRKKMNDLKKKNK